MLIAVTAATRDQFARVSRWWSSTSSRNAGRKTTNCAFVIEPIPITAALTAYHCHADRRSRGSANHSRPNAAANTTHFSW